MIEIGKAEGWLQLPAEALLPWASLNDIAFSSVVPGVAVGKGGALIAREDLPTHSDGDAQPPLMAVPKDLILSLERVLEHAKIDKDFREVLSCLGDFGRTPRGAILTFLLVQTSISCPHLSERVGVHSPFTDYVKSLPLELLPTFWTAHELHLLVGTTLAPAVTSKLTSLRREYDHLCSSASLTRWHRIAQPHLTFTDWLHLDAMYRSRALDFPGIGHCMVPALDLANHAAGAATNAIYDKDGDGNAVLLLRDGSKVHQGDEVTITYGDDKGACEMLFSYGFLEHDRESAQTLFLSLTIPVEDVSRAAKSAFADCAPGFMLADSGDGEVEWSGDFIYLLCVSADDGLNFQLARTVDGGEEELHAFFRGREIEGGAARLGAFLAECELWDAYRLRATAILQQRVFDQLQILYSTQEDVEAVAHGEGTEVRDSVYGQAFQLRRLEFELLERAYEEFERRKVELAGSEVVVRYLAEVNGGGGSPAQSDRPVAQDGVQQEREADDDDFS
ncbi:hypothetical protein LTR08_002899 [Meristemomyces frigidus]|nr:hypothetical protein LTR08_002899 [Meristemomyces frigidus]